MTNQNTQKPQPTQKPVESSHGGNKGRTIPRPPVRPKK